MNGLSTSGTTGLGTVEVSGRRRVPCPPTRITACMGSPPSDPLVVQARRAHRLRIQGVAAVDQQIALHRLGDELPIELDELGHSVTSTTASASRTALSADSAKMMPVTMLRACSSATGSYAETTAPSAVRRAESTSEDASRMSSVLGLKARPSSATRLPASPPRCL